ncbi:MAG: acireductone synthase [Deltaproteobacteria bacterium]|nr:MAG: acireductone synthase [Deltaproteobacteria bacterium]
MKYIVMDIEGTTTAISFVHEVLFPFARKRMKDFVEGNLNNDDVQTCLNDVAQTIQEEEGKTSSTNEQIEALIKWIDNDRKHGALKKLQGMIWKEGFEDGSLKGHFYDDVPVNLKKWKAAGYTLGVYSSGSVQAQKLIYKYSSFGDMTDLLSFYFDTAIGHKREVSSYKNIIHELGGDPSEYLFLSDVFQELDAAQQAGMKTIQLERQEIVKGDHPIVKDFNQIEL